MKGLDYSKLPADPKTSQKIIDKAFELADLFIKKSNENEK